MNILDAIKSGRPFKRKEWPGFGVIELGEDKGDSHWTFSQEDVLADDWEIEPKRVDITPREFWNAYGDALKLFGHEAGSRNVTEVIKTMAVALGLADE